MKAIASVLAVIVFLLLPPAIRAQTLNSKIETKIVCTTGKSGRKMFSISCSTREMFNNGSTEILFNKKRHGNNFTIAFTGVRTPKRVTKNIEPARTLIPLGRLRTGVYEFRFTTIIDQKTIPWAGTLVVQDTSFSWSVILPN